MPEKRVFVVTGSNKGIGKSIVKQLILNASKYKANNFIVYVTSRNLSLGAEVVEEFSEIYKSQLLDNNVELKAYKLDISDYDEVNHFKAHLVSVDVLVNNAGIASRDIDFSNGRIPPTLQVNYYDTLNMIETFLPIIKSKGRLITVSSGLGNLNFIPKETVPKFLTQDLTIAKVNQLMENYIQSVRTNTLKQNGWPQDVSQFSVYSVAKTHVTALNYALQLQTDPDQKLILACCPGFCKTNLNDHRGLRDPDDGALTPVHLILEDLQVVNGTTTQQQKLLGEGVFWIDMEPKPWTANVVY